MQHRVKFDWLLQLGAMSAHWEDFYATHLPPNCFEDNRSLLKEFCDRHFNLKNNIVLVTVIKTLLYIYCSIKSTYIYTYLTFLLEMKLGQSEISLFQGYCLFFLFLCFYMQIFSFFKAKCFFFGRDLFDSIKARKIEMLWFILMVALGFWFLLVIHKWNIIKIMYISFLNNKIGMFLYGLWHF